jgi:hypothetical protein
MSKPDTLFEKGLALFSGLTSFMFVYYGIGILNAVSVPEWERVFAYIAIGYGLGNIYILSAAWRFRVSWTIWGNKLIAFCFFSAFAFDMWKTGIKSNLEYVGAVGIIFVLWLNWFAIKTLSQRGGVEVEATPAKAKQGKGKKVR